MLVLKCRTFSSLSCFHVLKFILKIHKRTTAANLIGHKRLNWFETLAQACRLTFNIFQFFGTVHNNFARSFDTCEMRTLKCRETTFIMQYYCSSRGFEFKYSSCCQKRYVCICNRFQYRSFYLTAVNVMLVKLKVRKSDFLTMHK